MVHALVEFSVNFEDGKRGREVVQVMIEIRA